jgi:hypothetical protein
MSLGKVDVLGTWPTSLTPTLPTHWQTRATLRHIAPHHRHIGNQVQHRGQILAILRSDTYVICLVATVWVRKLS